MAETTNGILNIADTIPQADPTQAIPPDSPSQDPTQPAGDPPATSVDGSPQPDQRLYADKYKDVENLERGYNNLQDYVDRKEAQYKQEVTGLQNQLDATNQTQPLVEFIQNDPQSLQYLTQRMGQSQQQQAQPQQQLTPGQFPTVQLPPRPVDYNELDAHDPSTSSGQWHQQVQGIQQQQNQQTLLNQVGQLIDNKFSSWDKKQQDATVKQQQANQFDQMQQDFRTRHADMDGVELKNFFDFVKNPPQGITLDDFHVIYERHRNNNRLLQRPSLQSKVTDVKNQPVVNAATIAAQPGPTEFNEGDDFLKGIQNETKQFKIFPSG